MAEKAVEKRSMRYVVIRCVMPEVTSQTALAVEDVLREAVQHIPDVTVDVSMSNPRTRRAYLISSGLAYLESGPSGRRVFISLMTFRFQ